MLKFLIVLLLVFGIGFALFGLAMIFANLVFLPGAIAASISNIEQKK
jgi:hypothetical protein